VAHDLIGNLRKEPLSQKAMGRINVAVVWIIGLIAMTLAYDPPKLITAYYTDAIGALSAGLFVPVVAGLWWRRANVWGGVASFSLGVVTYVTLVFVPGVPQRSGILVALPVSLLAMWIVSRMTPADPPETIEAVGALHTDA
jgi:sodium/pantothenate symporter